MKNIFFIAIVAFLFSASANAQSTVDSIAAKYKLQPMPDSLSIESTFPVIGSYQLNNAPMTGATTTMDSTSNTMGNVSISLDPVNKGVVWVSGLPEGKIKAYLKKSPSTYRILAQKTDLGKQIPEGTLYYDPTGNALNIALGAPYNDADPTAIFNMNNTTGANANTTMNSTTDANGAANGAMATNKVKVKTKTATSKEKHKVMFYTGTKQQTAAMSTSTGTNATGTSTNTTHQ